MIMGIKESRLELHIKKYAILYLILVCVISLSVPFFMRYQTSNPIIFGEESYYHLRIAREYYYDGIPTNDTFSYTNRDYRFNPYHILISMFAYDDSILELSSRFLSALSGILTILLFYLLLGRFKFKESEKILSSIFVCISPIYIYIFSSVSPLVIAIPLFLLGCIAYTQKAYTYLLLSLFIFTTLTIFSWVYPLISIILIFAYTIEVKGFQKRFYISSIIIILFSILYLSLFQGSCENIAPTFINSMFLKDYISDLGGELGLSIFSLVLFAVGATVLWGRKNQLGALYILTFIIFSLSLYDSRANLFLIFFISIFGGVGFYYLLKAKWSIKLIKELSLWLIVCGLIFSYLSFSSALMDKEPLRENWVGYAYASELPNGIVLSHYSRGLWIEYLSYKKVFLDSRFECSGAVNARYNASGDIFFSRNLDKTKSMLNNTGITYILIDEKMKDGLVWGEGDEGINFLFRNNETFKKLYDDKNVEIWEYLLG